MTHHPTDTVPRHKPPTLKKYLSRAAHALFPKNNGRRLFQVFEHLLQQHSASSGWVERKDLKAHWGKAETLDEVNQRRLDNAFVNGVRELRKQLLTLNWAVPNFNLTLEENPPGHAERFRLLIERRSAAWDFVGKEAPHTEASEFCFSFETGPEVRLPAQVWCALRKDQKLEIEAVRESPQSQWRPPDHAEAYLALRSDFFEKASAAAVKAGRAALYPGELWGIKEVRDLQEDGTKTVHITTTRISYEDYLFLRSQCDRKFEALPKECTFRSWLGMDGVARDRFCPPYDAMCVSVAITTRGPEPKVYMGKQRLRSGATRWELSAMGSASSNNLLQEEKRPDLHVQVQSVALRETGLRFKPEQIQWLGFARSLRGGDSSVIALVETNLTPAEIRKKFEARHEKQDLIDLHPVKLAEMPQWIRSVPPAERGELLEVGLALVAMHYGKARPA